MTSYGSSSKKNKKEMKGMLENLVQVPEDEYVEHKVEVQRAAYEAGIRRAVIVFLSMNFKLTDNTVEELIKKHCAKDYHKILNGESIHE